MSALPLPDSISRLLCIQLADIGDLVVTTPALHVLRQCYPTAQIDLLTTPHAAPILTHTGLVNHVYLAPRNVVRVREARRDLPALLALLRRLRGGRYDAVLCFHHLTTWFGVTKYALLTLVTGAPIRAGLDNGRGWFLTHAAPDHGWGVRHQAEYYLDVVGQVGATPQSPEDMRPRVGVSAAERAWAAERLPLPADQPTGAAKIERYHVIHAGSGGFSLARRWEAEKFAALATQIVTDSGGTTQIVLVGGKDDDVAAVSRAVPHPILNLAGQTTLNQLAAVLARAEAFTGADSGVMHLAGAIMYAEGSRLGRVDALFGPSNHQAWRPYTPANAPHAPRLHRSSVRCSPCSYVGHTLGLRHGCEARTCMKLLIPARVIADPPPVTVPVPPPAPALTVLGVPIHRLTFPAFVDQVGQWIAEGAPRQICTVNPEYIMLAQRDVLLYLILSRADLCVADGVGVLWAAARLGHPLPERVTGSDGLLKLAERGAREGWRLFLLGAAPGVAEQTAHILQTRFPGLHIAGVEAGSAAPDAEDALAARIAASRADLLFVAFGQGKQDHWIARNLPRLGVKVAIGVGGSFDFVAGVAQRAPLWMQRTGLEWLHRLIQQPWRWRRMLRLPLFVIEVWRRGQRGPFAFAPIRRDEG